MYPWDDEQALTTLKCRMCSVELYDRDSMMSHLRGKPHLMMLQRIRDDDLRKRTGVGLAARSSLEEVEYDGGYWEREQGPRGLRKDQARFLDEKGLDRIQPKFKDQNYDHGQFHFRPDEFHCEICDVWVRSRDQMQAHKVRKVPGVSEKKLSQ